MHCSIEYKGVLKDYNLFVFQKIKRKAFSQERLAIRRKTSDLSIAWLIGFISALTIISSLYTCIAAHYIATGKNDTAYTYMILGFLLCLVYSVQIAKKAVALYKYNIGKVYVSSIDGIEVNSHSGFITVVCHLTDTEKGTYFQVVPDKRVLSFSNEELLLYCYVGWVVGQKPVLLFKEDFAGTCVYSREVI